jgi:toxin secretion/phage lysis holin
VDSKLFRTIIAGLGGVASYAFGGWSALLGILLAFVVVDYVSGVVAAALEGRLSSSVGLRGIARKVFIFVMVAIAHQVDSALGENHLFRDATIFFYLANELLSVLENVGRIGVPIPPGIQRAVEILRGRGEVSDVPTDPGRRQSG